MYFKVSSLFLSLFLAASAQVSKVDYRDGPCMPPVKPELPMVKALKAAGGPPCLIFARPIAAVAMAEYFDCQASKTKARRSFSVLQVLECALPKLDSCACLPTSKPITGVDYIANVGLELETNYAAKDAAAVGTGKTCDFTSNDVAYKLTSNMMILSRNESVMATALKNSGPILVLLYMNSTRAFAATPGSLITYTTGILDTDNLCPATSVSSLLEMDPVKGFSAVKVPVTLVGYDTLSVTDGCNVKKVDVWIARTDLFGPNWGMKGYFYMKRGINACNVVMNPVQILV